MIAPRRPLRLLVCAGEPSGDYFGASVVRELRALRPDVEVFGLGGDHLAAEGTELVAHVRDLSVIGFVEILRHMPRIKALSWRLLDLVAERRPDAALLVDYSGFNVRMAGELRQLRVPVAYYIAPKVWVWREHRIRFLRDCVDRMLVLFRFEEALWRAGGVPATFVGHPAGELVRPAPDRAAFLRSAGLDPARPVLAILPGSRRSELRYMLAPLLAAAAELVRRESALQPLLALSTNVDPGLLALGSSGPPPPFVQGKTHEVLGASRLALVACGTAALEAALLGVPNVVVYRMNALSYKTGRPLVKIDRFALPNILTARDVVPELIQDDMTPAAIVAAALPLLPDGGPRQKMLEDFADVRASIGPPGAAARAAAEVLAIAEASRASRDERLGRPSPEGTRRDLDRGAAPFAAPGPDS